MTFQISLDDTSRAIAALRGFVPLAQLSIIGEMCRGEEGDFFRAKMVEYAERVAKMPKTYEQDGMGDEAIAHLHYFTAGADWYITEKDMEDEQHQAFGCADLGYGKELGYISLVELCAIASVEIDLHWIPKTLREVKQPETSLPPGEQPSKWKAA